MAATILILILWALALVMLIKGPVTIDGETINLRPWSLIPGILGWIILFFASVTIVGAGEVGVPVTFGHVGSTSGPGIMVTAPWTNVKQMSTKIQNYTMVHQTNEGAVQGDDTVVAHTLDNADVSIDSTVLFDLPSRTAGYVVQHLGSGYIDTVVRPTIRSTIADAAAQYDATDLAAADRSSFEADVKGRLQQAFSAFDLQIERVQIRQVVLPQAISDAVNAKIKAGQDLAQLSVKAQQASVQADIARTQAKATADSQQIVACGGQTVLGANGKAAVIPNDKAHCDQQQLTPAYLTYLYIQALNAMANSPNHSTLITPSLSSPLITINPGG